MGVFGNKEEVIRRNRGHRRIGIRGFFSFKI